MRKLEVMFKVLAVQNLAFTRITFIFDTFAFTVGVTVAVSVKIKVTFTVTH